MVCRIMGSRILRILGRTILLALMATAFLQGLAGAAPVSYASLESESNYPHLATPRDSLSAAPVAFGNEHQAVNLDLATGGAVSGIVWLRHTRECIRGAFDIFDTGGGKHSYERRELPAAPGALALLAVGCACLVLAMHRRSIVKSMRALADDTHACIERLPEILSGACKIRMSMQSTAKLLFADGQKETFAGFTVEIDFAGLLRSTTGGGAGKVESVTTLEVFKRRSGLAVQTGRLFVLSGLCIGSS